MDRKYCADCGQPNLDTEKHCWACGGPRFAPPGTKPVGERTQAFGVSAGDQTVAWDTPAARRPTWVMPSAIAGMALVACLGGYLLGRANWQSKPASKASGEQFASVQLPAPPRRAVPNMAESALDPALVTIHSKDPEPPPVSSVAPPPPPAPALNTPATGTPPPALVYPTPAQPPVSGGLATEPRPMEPNAGPATPAMPRIRVNVPAPSSNVTASRTGSGGTTRPAAPVEEPSLPAPSREQAVVALRNDSESAVEVTLDGNGSRTAYIPAGSTVPLRLEPGSYQLKATSGGASSARSSLSLRRNRTYTMLVNRQTENGKESLVLIEPLEPSFDE
jgi:hypothetical protein